MLYAADTPPIVGSFSFGNLKRSFVGPPQQLHIRSSDKAYLPLYLPCSVIAKSDFFRILLRRDNKLRSKGVGIYFEEQNLDSMKTENEMLIFSLTFPPSRTYSRSTPSRISA